MIEICRIRVLASDFLGGSLGAQEFRPVKFGRGDDTVGNPHRAQISQFELFELTLLLKLDTGAPCRAIRGHRISVNSTLPPLTPGARLIE